jgi:uncharacterized protein DUF1990
VVVSSLVRNAGRMGGQARWGAGLLLAAHSHVMGGVAIDRVTECAPFRRRHPAQDRLLPGAAEVIQRASHGVGPLVLRRYRIRIIGARLSPEQLIRALRADLNAATPAGLAAYEKIRGRRNAPMRLGDEYAVHLAGPWACRVRVIECEPTSFRLATLRGHMEAGEIEFSCAVRSGRLVFTIESWARSGDRMFDLLYNRLPVASEVQLHMWSRFCARAATIAGGEPDGPVTVLTRRHPGTAGSSTASSRRRQRRPPSGE